MAGGNVIQDFNRTQGDVINLHNIPNLTSFADVLNHTTDFGAFSIITVDSAENIWVIGQTKATYQATDFSFV